MNRIPILAGGAVLAAVVLCGGAVTVANAFSTAQPTSQVLSIAGVTTATSPTSSASASPAPSASATAEPGDDKGGVTVVTPSDPTKIDGKGCAHLGRHGADDPADHDANDDNGGRTGTHHDGENEPGHHEFLPGGGTQGGSGTDDGNHHHRGGSGGGNDDGSGHH